MIGEIKEFLIKFPRGELYKVSLSSSGVKVYNSERYIHVQSKHKVSIFYLGEEMQ